MKARLFRAKSRGQSIPLIALMIVLLFGMVGLSVDVGNTYAANRNAVRATDAATLAAMDKLIKNGDDASIGTVIAASYRSNGIDPQMDPGAALGASQRRISAYYLDSNGNRLGACSIGNCGTIPTGIAFIQIQAEGTVDTYFARVVGRNTLPVKAQAFAAQCTPLQGVYPLAVNIQDLDASGFIPPSNPDELPYYGIYRDNDYPNGLRQRRIFMKPNLGMPGSFSQLRWLADASNASGSSTADMFTGDGNLDLGFQEAPWPQGYPEAAPAGYPLYPGQLTDRDWIHANTGWASNSGVDAALDDHILHKTQMYLPIIDGTAGTGANASVRFARMGAFYIRGYSNQGGGNAWMDLVYLGPAKKTACLRTNIDQGLRGLGIDAQVFVNPRWQQGQPAHQPIAYQFVMDVSGSMNWDFIGHGSKNGNDNGPHWQCETNFPNDPLPYNSSCSTPPDIWHIESERRIYIAKNAILNFINLMDTNDTMRLIVFSSDSSGHGYATSPAGWSSDKATLRQTVLNAGRYNNQTYQTFGGTAGAQGMQKAAQLISSVPTSQNYRPVVIYLTDGVANFFLNGDPNPASDVCPGMPASQAYNTPVPCQVGVTNAGVERPITAMITQANNMKAANPNLSVYVIGMANAPQTGLDRVASDPSMYFPATTPGAVDSIFTQINAQVEGGNCVPAGGYQWIDHVDTPHLPSATVFPDLSATTLGYAYIYQPSGGTPLYTLPIVHDSITGKLSFAIPPPDPANPNSSGITPGNYEMAAYVGYQGDDHVSRMYDWFINPNTLTGASRTSFSVTSADTLGRSVPLDPVFLDLRPTVRLCPTP